jgi:SAM-dependent methyltransferase
MGLEPEMDAALQAAQILKELDLSPTTTLLDGGCGAGHFIHSLQKRGLNFKYLGVDYSPTIIQIGKKAYQNLGLDPSCLILESLDDLHDFQFEVAILLNTLSFNPDFRRPINRLVECGAKTLLIRDNFGDTTRIVWEVDGHLDPGANHLKGYWNTWSRQEMEDFLRLLGFQKISWIQDQRTLGQTELVVGKPYHWEFLLASFA